MSDVNALVNRITIWAAIPAVLVLGMYWYDYRYRDEENAVREHLNDPRSAQFQNERSLTNKNGNKVVCGEVNAKNGFGGYVGFTRFYVEDWSYTRVGIEKVGYDQGFEEQWKLVGCGF